VKSKFIERPRTFCALGGALVTATALPNVVPIMHAVMGCGGSIYWNQYGSTGYLGAGYCGGLAAPSSNIQEKDVVFGGIERLEEQVRSTIELMEGGLYIILTGCTPDIIGDDIHSLVKKFQAEGCGVIGAETGGFRGDGYAGYDMILSALAGSFVTPKSRKKAKKVNLLGIVPGQDAFWRGNLIKLRSLLERLGLEVNSFFTEHDSLDEIKESGNASLSIVVSEFFGVKAAAEFESAHGIPYCESTFPIGPSATEIFLRKIASELKISGKRVDSLVEEETKNYFRYVERVADAYNDLDWQRRAVVVGDANYAPAITKFIADDLGWLPEMMVVTSPVNEDDEPKITRAVENLESSCPIHIVYETDPTEIKSHFWKYAPRRTDALHQDVFSPGFVIGSHLEREFAADIGADHLTVSSPVGNRVVLNRGYAGFDGSLSLIEDLLSVIVFQR
jgi:nitrogenase molybdenum-iron protein beta chain